MSCITESQTASGRDADKHDRNIFYVVHQIFLTLYKEDLDTVAMNSNAQAWHIMHILGLKKYNLCLEPRRYVTIKESKYIVKKPKENKVRYGTDLWSQPRCLDIFTTPQRL